MLLAAGALLLVLLAFSPAYGYHRDELYFRLLPAAWGYTDQPPLTPLLVHGISLLSDTVWAIRIPAALAAATSVVVVAGITAEAGGDRRAQTLAAWGYGFADFTLQLGHVMLTASLDLLVWPLVILLALRAVLRDRPVWWVAAGLVAGASLYNKLLVLVLLAGLAVGLLLVRAPARTWAWATAGAMLTIVIGAPNLVFQATHGFPQLAMGSALSSANGMLVRPFVVPFLTVLLGPTLVPVWIAGLVAIGRRPAWRPLRLITATFVVVMAIVIEMGAQFYYCYGVLAAVFAVGCIPVVEWAGTRGRRRLVIAAVAINTVAGAIVSLPIVPLPVLGLTPIPAWDKVARDQVGWPRYAAEVDVVRAAHSRGTIVLTANYGEAGAIERFAPSLASRVYSGHNGMHALTPPPAGTRTVVAVGRGLSWLQDSFAGCRTVGHLDSGLAVHSEEQGAPVQVCTGRTATMSSIWARTAHLG
ncbi:glycosyltransferase family 39 protein [Amnibacterium sp.]|uniref:glycosyltransferase family 39 protein n=1 Tax=Amnibacterium sp. TaxID=1872496 RepID=UPI0026037AF6|nr:glycosyltransferase family 39 protein [Amnibacterium sp.]MCU1474970.1 glycosyltransferase family 39 protein [Amnibacterium sp.]